MSKRILIFSLVYYPRFIGGAEVAVKEITDRIPVSEFEFDMITMRKHASRFERIGNVNIYRVGLPWRGKSTQSSAIFPLSKYLFIFFAFLKALELHRKRRYDLTWSIMANYAGFSSLFFKWVRPRVPFLLTLQEGDPLWHIRDRVGILHPLFRKIFTKANHVQAISFFLSDWARREGARSIEVVPNGVDVKKFEIRSLKSEKIEEIRKKFGIRQSETILITTSRLVEKNGVGDIIESLTYLPEDTKLFILGGGTLEQELKQKADSLGLKTHVFFIGFVSHKDLPDYLHASDIFIRPSLSEGFGLSFVEAMAANLPVIATKVGGIPDFLVDNETGLFCKVNDPKSIAEKVTLLQNNPALKREIVENAQKMVSEKYDWNFVAEKMKAVFERVSRQLSK